MKFKNKLVLVLGAGASGKSAKKFLEKRGAGVVVHDDNDAVTKFAAEYYARDFDLCVISPGVPAGHPLAVQMRENGVPVIGELELGFSVRHKKVIAVTGTNGKTTVVNMVKVALGKRAVLCGNVGIPVTSVAKQLRMKTAVTEVSSFQLETAMNFRANIAVLLNITQDHLERHGTMDEYIRCKSQIFANQKKCDKVILNFDDAVCRAVAPEGALFFSTTAKVRGIYLDGSDIILNIKRKARKIFSLADFGEDKPHGIENILTAVLVCVLARARKKAIINACKSVQGEHRIQYIGGTETKSGAVMFYNDSKATNIASTLAACRCFKSVVNLILGGVSKGQDFTELFEKLPGNAEHIFVFGQCADEIIKAAWQRSVELCTDLRDAVQRAVNAGIGPRVVLLSPACASFDMFKNYEDRGEQFIKIVKEFL